MQISKANHLKRLLQTQDVLLGTLCYVVTVESMLLLGQLSLGDASYDLLLIPFVMLLCVFASVTKAPKLHGWSIWAHGAFAARYALIFLTGMLAFAYVGHLDLRRAVREPTFPPLVVLPREQRTSC
jgi:hypothetical protein